MTESDIRITSQLDRLEVVASREEHNGVGLDPLTGDAIYPVRHLPPIRTA